MFGHERARDPFCRRCGCEMKESTETVGEPRYDRKTGLGSQPSRKVWHCSKGAWQWGHDTFNFGPEFYQPVKKDCTPVSDNDW